MLPRLLVAAATYFAAAVALHKGEASFGLAHLAIGTAALGPRSWSGFGCFNGSYPGLPIKDLSDRNLTFPVVPLSVHADMRGQCRQTPLADIWIA